MNTKASEIRRMLDGWVKKSQLLGPNERLVFSMRIEMSPQVVRDPEDSTDVVVLMNMPAEKFFDRDRLARAGGEGRLIALAINLIQRKIKNLRFQAKKAPGDLYCMSDFLRDVPDWHALSVRLRLDGKSGSLVMAAIVQAGLEFEAKSEPQGPQA